MDDQQTPKIIKDKDSKITKVKDPKKVEAGKNLTFLRAEKRRHEQEKIKELEQKVEGDETFNYYFKYVGLGVIVAIIAYYGFKTDSQPHEHVIKNLEPTKCEKQEEAIKGDLFTFD